jgi:DNA-binding CsgD family transcriptional regulator
MLKASVTTGDIKEYAVDPAKKSALWHDRKFLFFFFGMTLFQTWICVTSATPLLTQNISSTQLQTLHTGGILTMLLLVILLRRRLVKGITHRAYSIVVAIAAVGGTIITESTYFVGSIPDILVIIATLLTSCSVGALLALWGEGYGRMPTKAAQAKVTLSAMAGCLALYLLISTFPQGLSLALVSAFPLLAVVCLHRVIHVEQPDGPEMCNEPVAVSPTAAIPPRPTVPPSGILRGYPDRDLTKLLIYIVLCSIPMNFLNTFFVAQEDFAAPTDWPTVYSVALFVLVGIIGLEMLMRRFNKSALPVLIGILVTAGLPLHFFLGAPLLVVRSFMASGYFLFVAVFYSYLGSNVLAGRRAPFLIFAFGNCANTIGLIFGWAIGRLTSTFLLPLVAYIAVGIIYTVLFIGLFLLSSKDNAFGNEPAPPKSTSRGNRQDVGLFIDAVYEQCVRVATEYGLSNREEEILNYLVRGRSVSTIAREINLSQNTIKTHVEHIYKKLDTHTREELLRKVEEVQG